jgi:hypothetical protein
VADDLLLEYAGEALGNTIGLRFGDKHEAWRNPPELDLTEKVLGDALRAVVYVQRKPPYIALHLRAIVWNNRGL